MKNKKVKDELGVLDAIGSVCYELFCTSKYYAKLLCSALPFFIMMASNYFMYYAGVVDDEFKIGGVLLTPFAFYAVAYIINKVTSRVHVKGTTCPIPNKRFTTEEDDIVHIDVERLQELTLYMAELEDWFEKKGLM